MVFGIHLTYGINDNALFINDVCGAQGAFGHFAVHLFLAPCLVGFQDGQVGIGDEMERQVIFGDEALPWKEHIRSLRLWKQQIHQ